MRKNKIWLVGAYGLLGSEFRELLNDSEYYKSSSKEADITNLESLEKFVLDKSDIKYIINCAASCDAEALESNPEYANIINVEGPKNLSIIANKLNAVLIHISTDYVFDGKKSLPYQETDKTNPLSVYGCTKVESEQYLLNNTNSVVIFRTAWLFSQYGRDFVKIIRKIASNNKEIRVIFDQVGSPCFAHDLAYYILEALPMIKDGTKEIFHLTNEGVASWYDLAQFIVNGFNLDCKVIPIHSHEYVQKAKRPHYSVLDKEKFKKYFNINIRHYIFGLHECIKLIKERDYVIIEKNT